MKLIVKCLALAAISILLAACSEEADRAPIIPEPPVGEETPPEETRDEEPPEEEPENEPPEPHGEPLTLSVEFGVVEGTAFTLTVTPERAGNRIYYTTDGTPAAERFSLGEATEGLFLYGGDGITIAESMNPDDYALTPNVTYQSGTYTFGYVGKGVPLSLIEVDEDGEIVAARRGTFVFAADGKSHFGNVPVVCLSAPVDEWIGTDKKSGVYNTVTEELKLRAHLEYYDYGADEFFALNTQIKRGGNWTAALPLRTLNANFKKDENGDKNEKPGADIFRGRIALGTGEPVRGEVRRFRLHSGGNDTFGSFFNDAFIQRVVSLSETSVATAAYRPCVLYINGEYWGLYALREHYNEDYIEYTFGVDADDVVYVDKGQLEAGRNRYGFNVKTDDAEIGLAVLDELHDFLEINTDGSARNVTKDWASDEVYEEFCNLVDVDSLIDYILIEGYVGNRDFMLNNVRMWRTVPTPAKKKTRNSKYGDGKWRFMLHDTDLSCVDPKGQYYLSEEAKSAGKNLFDFYVGNCTGQTGYIVTARDHRILTLPLQNAQFRQKLWERAQEIQEIFAPEKAVAVIDAMEAEVEPLYADKVARWGASGYSVTSWKNAVENRRKFLRERGGYFLDNVRSAFGIEDGDDADRDGGGDESADTDAGQV